MTVRPIIFSAPMVRALLSGSKSMTRRVMKPQPENSSDGMIRFKKGGWFAPSVFSAAMECAGLKAPYEPGDLLYVRENWRASNSIYFDAGANWSANYSMSATRPSIHMPRWASRLTLEVTAVKIERLQEISEKDAEAEGAEEMPTETGRLDVNGNPHEVGSFRLGFSDLWESLHGPGSWDANPWVVAISFTVHRQNVDALIAERAEA